MTELIWEGKYVDGKRQNPVRVAGTKWEYLKVPQKGFETLQPSRLEHLVALKPMSQL